MTFLTVLGHWNEVNAFLDTNPIVGFGATIFHLFFAFMHYHSKDEVTKMRIDSEETKASISDVRTLEND